MARLSEIIVGLEELRLRGHSSLWIDPQNHWWLTIEARDTSTKGDSFWIQIQGATLNMKYLDEDDPMRRLTAEVDSFPQEFRQVAWDYATYATFEMPQQFSSELPKLIDRIARQYFGLNEDYRITYRVEDLGQ